MIDAKTALMVAEENRNRRKKEALVTIKAMLEDQVMAAVAKGNYSCAIPSSEFGDNWSIFTSEFIHFRHFLEKLGFEVLLYERPIDYTGYLISGSSCVVLTWSKKEESKVPASLPKKRAWWKLW
jgi:hypothetical protein